MALFCFLIAVGKTAHAAAPLGQFPEVKDFRGALIEVSIVSESEAQELFEIVAQQEDLYFGYTDTNCDARAHLMAIRFEAMGIIVGKVFATGKFYMPSRFQETGIVHWRMHVAPIVLVKKENGLEVYVLDPSQFSRAVPVKVWTDNLLAHPQARFRSLDYTNRFMLLPAFDFGSYRADFSRLVTEWREQDLIEMEFKLNISRERLSEFEN